MKYIVIIALLFFQFVNGQSREIRGTVTSEKEPLPGVSIMVKGTTIGINTDFDGEFKLNVPDSLNIIVISYIGFVTKEIDVSKEFNKNGEYNLEETIPLEEQVISCYFYPHHFGIGYYGGFNNSGLGFMVEFFDPYSLKITIRPELKFGYQTNSSDNYQLKGEFNLIDLFRVGRNSFDIDFSYREIETEENFSWQSLKLKAKTNFRIFYRSSTFVSFGIGRSIINSNQEYGLTGGFEQYLLSGIKVDTQLTKWQNYWQIQSGIIWRYKKINIFYEFNSIENYTEHNVGMVYFINI